MSVQVVQEGRVRLVMRNGYITKLLGAGEPTISQFESDSGSDSESEPTTPAPRLPRRPLAKIATFVGPKSGDSQVNQARYEEFVSATIRLPRPSFISRVKSQFGKMLKKAPKSDDKHETPETSTSHSHCTQRPSTTTDPDKAPSKRKLSPSARLRQFFSKKATPDFATSGSALNAKSKKKEDKPLGIVHPLARPLESQQSSSFITITPEQNVKRKSLVLPNRSTQVSVPVRKGPTAEELEARLVQIESELAAQKQAALKESFNERGPATVIEKKVSVRYADSLQRPSGVPRIRKGDTQTEIQLPQVAKPKSETGSKSVPLWRLQNAARFGSETVKTKSLTTPAEPKPAVEVKAKSIPPSSKPTFKDEKKETLAKVSEPTINIAPPTPVLARKTFPEPSSQEIGPPSCISWDESFELAEAFSDASVLDDESQYSAVTHFFPKKLKRPPVPGMWLKDGVELISINKHFKKNLQTVAVSTQWKSKRKEKSQVSLKVEAKPTVERKKMVLKKKKLEEKDFERAVTERELSPLSRKKEQVLKATNVTAVLERKTAKAAAAHKWIVKQRSAASKSLKVRRKPPPIALAVIDKDFRKANLEARTMKTLKSYSRRNDSSALRCAQPTNKITKTEQKLCRNSAFGGAKVIVVDAPIEDVNISRVNHKCVVPKKERVSMPSYNDLKKATSGCDEEKEAIAAMQANNGAHSDTEYDNARETPRSAREGSVAAAILDEMRGKDAVVDWSKNDNPSIFLNNGQEPLILPDQSILEEYIKRKRGRLERLHSEPIPENDEDRSLTASPCNSTASEFIPASAVRVHEPSSPRVPVITSAPQKCSSRMSNGEPSTPTMLETQQPPNSLNNFNSTPQAFLRHDRRQVARPILFQAPASFDTPKTPFESALQQQANQIARRASVNSTYSENGDCRSETTAAPPSSHVRQNSQDGSISSSFTAALAANQPARHERYAAHIPVNRGDTSGRQSVNSVDSQASGVLETASKQLDQVIDQARHRHHQHRSRFKEAIEYLDQIFEDLKRECDSGAAGVDDDTNNNSKPVATRQVIDATSTLPKEPRKPQLAPTVPDPSPSYATQSLPTRSHKHKTSTNTHRPPSPVEVVFRGGKQHEEPELSETIVLPKKPDKMDFTRRWLQDDLSAFGMSSPTPLVLGPEMAIYSDVDEHSLGSCSAEVAAITGKSKEKREKKKSKNGHKPHADVKMHRPQVVRPQAGTNSNAMTGPRAFPVDFDSHLPLGALPRVSSFDRVSDSGIWRSGSQEPSSIHLNTHPADPRPSPSAFQNVSPAVQRNSLRASIRSLPDSRVPSMHTTPDPPRDPALAIDALVAELELNTEEVRRQHAIDRTVHAEKRRSFPTTVGRLNDFEAQRKRSTDRGPPPPTQPRRVTQPANLPSHSYQQRPAFATKPAPNLDEVASMLTSVANEFAPPKLQQNGHRRSLPRQSSGASNQSSIYAVPHMTPFETINKERINPSRVEAMQSMFDRAPGTAEWRRGPQPFKSASRDDDHYYDIAELQAVLPTPKQQLVHPAPHGRNGSAGSSQNGGYYSSNSSDLAHVVNAQTGGSSNLVRRGSLVGRQSLHSRAASQEEDDDGYYDNIGQFDDRRFSRGSDVFESGSLNRSGSTKSHMQTKIGSFFRKIGSGRPPGAAASLVSLNKAGIEPVISPSGPLMKSSSLSQDPWNKHVLGGPSLPSPPGDKSRGIGQRLKNSIFGSTAGGSKKRLNG